MGEEAELRLSVSYTIVELFITATLLLTISKPFFFYDNCWRVSTWDRNSLFVARHGAQRSREDLNALETRVLLRNAKQ